jgi:hypothetical protein
MADIDDLVAKFAKQVNSDLTAFRAESAKDQKKQVKDIPELKVVVRKQAAAKFRTPKEQADKIVEGHSWACTSSHMTDNARHVALNKSGKYVNSPHKDLTKEEYVAFKDAWNDGLAKAVLRNYEGKAVYNETDAYHVELPDSKLPPGDKRVQECLGHYAKMTRDDGMKKNEKFETNDYVKKFLDNYVKK